MRDRMIKALVFLAILSAFAADVSVGCGSNQYAYGPVEDKIATDSGFFLKIHADMYMVPSSFFSKVQIGDIVKGVNGEWTIVKPAYEPGQMTAPPPPSKS